MRANINFADKAVILGHNMEGSSDGSSFDEMIDAESIFIYKVIITIDIINMIMIIWYDMILWLGDQEMQQEYSDNDRTCVRAEHRIFTKPREPDWE